MKLRWLKGNFPEGKFRLQYEGGYGEWLNVPIGEDRVWCEHNIWSDDGWQYKENGEPIEYKVMYCDVCGKRRPE
jgi:hypothetical protein